MAFVTLGNGADLFSRTSASPDFSDWSALFAGNGADSITLGNGAPGPHGFAFSHLYVDGGNGPDVLTLFVTFSLTNGGNGGDTISVSGHDNWAYGGRGDDQLASDMRGNTGNYLDGGPGNDTLSSFIGPISALVRGDVLAGGSGKDTFRFDAGPNFSAVHVVNDQDGVASAGDEVHGNFAVVTDYEAGEKLVLGPTAAADGPLALSTNGGFLLEGGTYATLRGDLDPLQPTHFILDPEGHDLLVVFDPLASHPPGYYGSVVLAGFTDAGAILVG